MRYGVRIVVQLLLGVCLVVLGGYRHVEVGREGIACDYVVKDADVSARDFGNSLDCYVNEAWDVLATRTWRAFLSRRGRVLHADHTDALEMYGPVEVVIPGYGMLR